MDQLPPELHDMIIRHSINTCDALLSARRINTYYRDLVDLHIGALYNKMRKHNPDLPAIDFRRKTNIQKRRAIVNACLDEDRQRTLRLHPSSRGMMTAKARQGHIVYANYIQMKNIDMAEKAIDDVMRRKLSLEQTSHIIKIVKQLRRDARTKNIRQARQAQKEKKGLHTEWLFKNKKFKANYDEIVKNENQKAADKELNLILEQTDSQYRGEMMKIASENIGFSARVKEGHRALKIYDESIRRQAAAPAPAFVLEPIVRGNQES